MTPADWGSAALSVFLFAGWVVTVARSSTRDRHTAARLDQMRADSAATVADKDSLIESYLEHMADQGEQLRRVTAERDTFKRDGEKAAVAGMVILAHERQQHARSIASLGQSIRLAITADGLDLPVLPKRVPGASMPEILPSGDYLITDDDGEVILQLEGYESKPLPAGTNGTRGKP